MAVDRVSLNPISCETRHSRYTSKASVLKNSFDNSGQ